MHWKPWNATLESLIWPCYCVWHCGHDWAWVHVHTSVSLGLDTTSTASRQRLPVTVPSLKITHEEPWGFHMKDQNIFYFCMWALKHVFVYAALLKTMCKVMKPGLRWSLRRHICYYDFVCLCIPTRLLVEIIGYPLKQCQTAQWVFLTAPCVVLIFTIQAKKK